MSYRFSRPEHQVVSHPEQKRKIMDESTLVEQLPPPKNKAELLDRIRGEHAALEQTIDRLTEEQITAPVEGQWSVKDMLAHITAWEQVMLGVHLGGRPFDQVGGVTYGTSPTAEINEAFSRRDKDRPLPDVLDAFRRSYQQVLAALDGVSEARLFGP